MSGHLCVEPRWSGEEIVPTWSGLRITIMGGYNGGDCEDSVTFAGFDLVRAG